MAESPEVRIASVDALGGCASSLYREGRGSLLCLDGTAWWRLPALLHIYRWSGGNGCLVDVSSSLCLLGTIGPQDELSQWVLKILSTSVRKPKN